MSIKDSASFSRWAIDKRKLYGNLKKLDIANTLEELYKKATEFFFADEEANSFKLRRNTDLHPTIKKEHLWERIITMCMPKACFYNQFSFNRTNNIDLVQTDANGAICRLFELKTGSNELAHAAYEIIFYYALMLRARREELLPAELAKPVTLTIVAPNYYCKNKSHYRFMDEIQKNLSDNPYYEKALISFLPLPFSSKREEFEENTRKLRRKIIGGTIASDNLKSFEEYFLKNL